MFEARGLSEQEPLLDVAYLYDGTLEGLLSAVFLAYERHEQPRDIVCEDAYEPRMLQSAIHVETDFERSSRVRRGLERACGKAAFRAVMKASTSDDDDAGIIVYRFIRYAMERVRVSRPSPILDELSNPVVLDLHKLVRHVDMESERVRQFVRFSHLENGVWYASIEPNANVIPLVMNHFSDRFNDQPFIIFDKSHHVAGVYDGRGWQLVASRAVEVPLSTDHDLRMQEAWKRFYDALCVDARYNPELRRHFMPVRFWHNLTEMKPRDVRDDRNLGETRRNRSGPLNPPTRR